jgi:tubulin alpha
MREIISIHVGQAGVYIGECCWKLYCLDHHIGWDGQRYPSDLSPPLPDDSVNVRFSETPTGKRVPRAVFIDLESNMPDAVRFGTHRRCFEAEQFINGKEDAASNYARGRYTVGTEIIDRAVDQIRKLTEACTNPQGCILFHSLGGGTGSGFGSLLLERLSEDYSKKLKFEFAVLPSSKLSTAIVEPYNAILATHATMNHSNLTFLVDNSALSRICSSKLDYQMPSYFDTNHLLSYVASSITKPHSLLNQQSDCSSFAQLHDILVPFSRAHFAVPSYAPIISDQNHWGYDLSFKGTTKAGFHSDNAMLKCGINEGKYIGRVGFYRSPELSWEEVNQAYEDVKNDQRIQWVDSSRNGVCWGVDYHSPIDDRFMRKSEQSLCVLSSTTAIGNAWKRVGRKFDLMYARKAYVHWYVEEGMEETLFEEAREDIQQLEKDYRELERETVLEEEGDDGVKSE